MGYLIVIRFLPLDVGGGGGAYLSTPVFLCGIVQKFKVRHAVKEKILVSE